MASARDTLLDSIIEYVARHGLSDLSLRELAAAVGTSHRMLLYHFDSREGLVAAIVESVEREQRSALDAAARTATTPADLVRAQWAQLADPSLRPFVALFFEVLALAVHERPGTDGFLAGLTDPWLDLADELARRMGVEIDRAELRLGVAVIRGLLIDVLASGEVDGPTAALERFLVRWDPPTGAAG
jgi:AcrR family transcriptional regulator